MYFMKRNCVFHLINYNVLGTLVWRYKEIFENDNLKVYLHSYEELSNEIHRLKTSSTVDTKVLKNYQSLANV